MALPTNTDGERCNTNSKQRKQTVYERAIQTIPWLCGLGWLTAVIGFAIKLDWLAKIGVATFLSGFAVWGLANGGGFLWAFSATVQKHGWRSLTKTPWSSALFILMMIFFLGIGVWFIWFLIQGLMPWNK